jgi:hypothetical protein
LAALRAGRCLPPGTFLVLISVKCLSRPQGHIAAGRIMSIEKSNDFIGIRTHDLPSCNIVLQPPTPPRALFEVFFINFWVYEAIGTAATPGLLCQPRVIVKMIVEQQMECRLAG